LIKARGIHVFQHSGDAFLSTKGKVTEATGNAIKVLSKAGYHMPTAGEEFLLRKLNWKQQRQRYVAFVAFGPGDFERTMERGKQVCAAGADEDQQTQPPVPGVLQ